MEPEAVLERKLIQYSCGALADQVGEYASGGSYLGGFSFYPESIPFFSSLRTSSVSFGGYCQALATEEM